MPKPAAPAAVNQAKPSEAAPVADLTAPLPPTRPGQVEVQVEAPFVFSGSAAVANVKPYSVAKVSFSSLPTALFPTEVVDPVVATPSPQVTEVKSVATVKPPEASAAKKPKKGIFGRVKGFFGAIFRR
jgi:hypothetical protein